MKWPFSVLVYRTFLLLSFGFLSISVSDDDGRELPRRVIDWDITPALRAPVDLEPGESFNIAIPIGSFYRMEPGKRYRIAVEYGDKKLKVAAETILVAP